MARQNITEPNAVLLRLGLKLQYGTFWKVWKEIAFMSLYIASLATWSDLTQV